MRIYDPRVGRFLSLDPLQAQYSELTPYQFASNSPISGIDLDGLEFAWAQTVWNKTTSGYETAIKAVNETYTGYQPYLNAIGRGLNSVAENLAPIRIANESDPKTIKESWHAIKSIPINLYTLPTKITRLRRRAFCYHLVPEAANILLKPLVCKKPAVFYLQGMGVNDGKAVEVVKVSDIAGNEGKVMDESGGSDDGIAEL